MVYATVYCMPLFCIQCTMFQYHTEMFPSWFQTRSPWRNVLLQSTLKHNQYFLHNGICYWDSIIRNSLAADSPLGPPPTHPFCSSLVFSFPVLSQPLSPARPSSPHMHFLRLVTYNQRKICICFSLHQAYILLLFCSSFCVLHEHVKRILLVPAS